MGSAHDDGLWYKQEAQRLLADGVKRMQAEIEIWRKRHPRETQFVDEEARAKVEGREPKYQPSRAYV